MAAASLIQLANHFRGTQVLSRPQPKIRETDERAARSARHQGPGERQARARSRRRRRTQSADGRAARRRQVDAGSAAARPSCRRSTPAELLEVSMIASVAGVLEGGALTNQRPFRSPHHSASMPALVGGGLRAKPGRSFARASRRAVPRRVSGIPAAGARLAAPAARERRGRDRARQSSRHLSGALHAGRRHEPVPLRPRDPSPASPASAARTCAAPPTIRAGCPARCSTASICTSKCRP